MAEIGDFKDLLDAIKSAKSILEPSKIELLREEARLDRLATLDIASINMLDDEIKDLRDKKEELEDDLQLSALDLQKFPLSSDTGNLQKYAARKYENINDALDAMSYRRDKLRSSVSKIKEMGAIQQEQQQKLLKTESKYKTRGAFSDVFERSDFDEAQRDYESQLKGMVDPQTNRPMYDGREIAMMLHFHNKAYIQQHAVELSDKVQESFDFEESKKNVAFVNWQNTASPSKDMGQLSLMGFENVEAIIEKSIFGDDDGRGGFVELVVNNAQTMYENKSWTPENAPIKISGGQAVYDDKWFDQEYIDINGFPTGRSRIEQIRFDMSTSMRDFLGHANVTEAFKSATRPGSTSSLLRTDISHGALAPGIGFGILLWGDQFKNMEDFYQHDTIQKHLNNRIIKQTSIKNNFNTIFKRNE